MDSQTGIKYMNVPTEKERDCAGLVNCVYVCARLMKAEGTTGAITSCWSRTLCL